MLEKSYYSKMRAILPETVSLIFDENGTEDLQSELLCIVGNLIDAEIQEGKLEDIDAINACIAEYDVFGEIVEQENEKIIQEMENQIGQNDWGAVYNFYLFLKGRACSQEEIAILLIALWIMKSMRMVDQLLKARQKIRLLQILCYMERLERLRRQLHPRKLFASGVTNRQMSGVCSQK